MEKYYVLDREPVKGNTVNGEIVVDEPDGPFFTTDAGNGMLHLWVLTYKPRKDGPAELVALMDSEREWINA